MIDHIELFSIIYFFQPLHDFIYHNSPFDQSVFRLIITIIIPESTVCLLHLHGVVTLLSRVIIRHLRSPVHFSALFPLY